MTVPSLEDIRELAAQLRVDSVRCSTAAGSGHPTSSMSAADVMAVLLTRHLRYDWQRPDDPANDHLIFSKGHASPLLYSMFKAVGAGQQAANGTPTARKQWQKEESGYAGCMRSPSRKMAPESWSTGSGRED